MSAGPSHMEKTKEHWVYLQSLGHVCGQEGIFIPAEGLGSVCLWSADLD